MRTGRAEVLPSHGGPQTPPPPHHRGDCRGRPLPTHSCTPATPRTTALPAARPCSRHALPSPRSAPPSPAVLWLALFWALVTALHSHPRNPLPRISSRGGPFQRGPALRPKPPRLRVPFSLPRRPRPALPACRTLTHSVRDTCYLSLCFLPTRRGFLPFTAYYHLRFEGLKKR